QELDVPHEAGQGVREELDRGHRADAARIDRRRVHVPALHQPAHPARPAASLQRFAVVLALERVGGAHDVADRLVAVVGGVRRLGPVGFLEDAGIGLLQHALAEVAQDELLLEDVVIEHVLGGLAEVDDPLAEVRRLHAVRHVLAVAGAGRVVVAADAADAAGDEVGVARILPLHEDAVAAEDGRGRMALGHLLRVEIDPRVDAEAADDPCDRIPVHLHEAAVLQRRCSRHVAPSRARAGYQFGRYPERSSLPRRRHLGSMSMVCSVKPRSVRIAVPRMVSSLVDTFAPGGSSMNGMNLSGNPGMVQPMQMPPTFGQRCPNVGGICIGCTMPGFPDKFMPFMDEPPGAKGSTRLDTILATAIRTLRGFTEHTMDMEPKWRRRGSELRTGYRPNW